MSLPRLVLVRHGETQSNVDKMLDSAPPGAPLNETGRRQARDLAAALGAEPIVAVHASIALRAQQTAAPLTEKLGLPMGVHAGAREVFVGELEMRGDEQALRGFGDTMRAWANGNLDTAAPGGESGTSAIRRMSETVREICAPHTDGVVVLCSHGAVIRLVSCVLADNLRLDVHGLALMPNTCRVTLQPHPTGWHCTEWPGDTPPPLTR